MRCVATASASAALVLVAAGAASAAPSDVTVSAGSGGNVITAAVNNSTDADIYCAFLLMNAGATYDDPVLDSVGFVYGEPPSLVVAPGSHPVKFTKLPAGNYQVDWACQNVTSGKPRPEIPEGWGTPAAISSSATAEAAPVSVVDEPNLFGSLSFFGS